MKVLFFGYSQMGAVALDVLAKQGHEVLAVVTHRDDPHENRWYRVPAEAGKAADDVLREPLVHLEELPLVDDPLDHRLHVVRLVRVVRDERVELRVLAIAWIDRLGVRRRVEVVLG